jgi:hypothetical protein
VSLGGKPHGSGLSPSVSFFLSPWSLPCAAHRGYAMGIWPSRGPALQEPQSLDSLTGTSTQTGNCTDIFSSLFPIEQFLFSKRILTQLVQEYFYRLHHSYLIKAYTAHFLIKWHISLIKKSSYSFSPSSINTLYFFKDLYFSLHIL